MIRYCGWTLIALFVSMFMRPGVRYGGHSFRWAVLRAAILKRDGHKCKECERQSEYKGTWVETHHIRRVADGGGHSPFNLVSLCRDCHAVQHIK